MDDLKIALVGLIKNSILLSSEEQLKLLDLVPSLNQKQIGALGKFLTQERDLWFKHGDTVLQQTEKILSDFSDEQVLVGTGTP